MKTVLGIDPGLQATGYALVSGDREGIRLLQKGVIRPRPGALEERLWELYHQIKRVLWEVPLDLVAMEDLFSHHHYPKAALLLGHVRGVICLASAERGVQVASLPPAEIKRALVGNGRASKVQVQRAVQRFMVLPEPPPTHVADALAVALTALSRQGVRLVPCWEEVRV
ncbi:MAG: crossover junction endodeoxyribonuclease RuvC [Armatimonadota bacterium]|nr:crossover junction endodeoxyribonuclease RuvC [Armatimonadota bacterium]MDR5703627.1 crossover junction endodeoxyribonuclease RuvC [Armatimonadota bacterium]